MAGGSVYKTVILFGAISGVVLRKVTVRTPFSMAALISSSCMRVNIRIVRNSTKTHLDITWKLERPTVLSIRPLSNSVSLFVLLRRLLGLRRYSQTTVLHLDVDILLGDTREFERSGDQVLLGVFVEVHPRLETAADVGASVTLVLKLLLILVLLSVFGCLASGQSVVEDAFKVVEGFVEENARHRSSS